LVGYNWWYDDSDYTVEHLEQEFNIPMQSPTTGNNLRANLIGRIDRVFSSGPNRFVHEYKSTSSSVDPDSDMWKRLTLNTQTRLYTYAAHRLGLGMCGVIYDVWRKPAIRPKKLTQAESKKFAADGLYCGESFNISQMTKMLPSGDITLTVNSHPAEVEPGAKEGTFAIRETPEMFGARLLQDITTRPDHYFARKELVHRAANIQEFEWELFFIYKTIANMKNTGAWYTDESQCEATFKCPYTDFCYNHRVVAEDEIPEGFTKRTTTFS
jgi:hypothetical protein